MPYRLREIPGKSSDQKAVSSGTIPERYALYPTRTKVSVSPIIISVSELTYAIKAQLEPMFSHLYVRGEISNFKAQQSGHLYFSLSEGGCQLSAVMFRSSATSLTQPLKNGDSVIAEGEISVYPPRGNYQIVVRRITPVGLGEALLKLQALKKKLSAQGYFERKRPLPKEIRRIGIVTSPTGAVLQDIINILTRRLGGFHLIVNPVRVQGETAAFEIARAIKEFSTYHLADVIIVCRGGGSAEDLAAFNDEGVAIACFECPIPIVSAVGHETDLSITDLVADLRAPTPSAAAELISKERSEQKERLASFSTSLQRLAKKNILSTRAIVQTFDKRLMHVSPMKKIELCSLLLDDTQTSLRERIQQTLAIKKESLQKIAKGLQLQSPAFRLSQQKSMVQSIEKRLLETISQRLSSSKQHVHDLKHRLAERISFRVMLLSQRFKARPWQQTIENLLAKRIENDRRRLDSIQANITALNPLHTLRRGYAIVFHEKSAQVIRSCHEIHPSEQIRVRVSDGEFLAGVLST